MENVGADEFGRSGFAVPFVEAEIARSVAGAGDDVVGVADAGEVADAEAAEVELDHVAELGARAALNKLIGIEERDEEAFAGGDGIAESDEEAAVWTRAEAFDVEAAFGFGREERAGSEAKFFEARVFEEVGEEAIVRAADGANVTAIGGGDLRREETLAGGGGLGVFVSAMGTDPVDAIANEGGAFEVGFGSFFLFAAGREKASEVGAFDGERFAAFVNPEGVAFVIGGDEMIFVESDGGGGVAHFPIGLGILKFGAGYRTEERRD